MLVNNPVTRQLRHAIHAEHDLDIEVKPKIGAPVIDTQDRLRLAIPGALRQGMNAHQNYGTASWYDGIRIPKFTRHGNNAALYDQVDREVVITVKKET